MVECQYRVKTLNFNVDNTGVYPGYIFNMHQTCKIMVSTSVGNRGIDVFQQSLAPPNGKKLCIRYHLFMALLDLDMVNCSEVSLFMSDCV